MKLHILGICGTFMGSLAQLAKALGHDVSGSDHGVYPPMSDQLEQAGIALTQGFDPEGIPDDVDLVVIGNAMGRGNASVEYVLERGIPYTSGPQWLGEHVLQGRWVLAVAGTHGKTTTASMLAWILEYAGMSPGYLIGGVPENFRSSATLGDSPFFVIEADEYDTAFFDKRSKFVHYRPRTFIANNLEFDHADIFPDLAAIERQFHQVIRTIPQSGQVIRPADCEAIDRVMSMGCWSSQTTFAPAGADWQWTMCAPDGSQFEVTVRDEVYPIRWSLSGAHNVSNAVAAMAAAFHVGVSPAVAAEALAQFQSVKRRMERVNPEGAIPVYDDFAHHPTAIATTLQGAKAQLTNTDGRLLAVLEPRSNTMKAGVHRETLAGSVDDADGTYWFEPENISWSLADVVKACRAPAHSYQSTAEIVEAVANDARPGDRILVMSNGGFDNMPRRLAKALEEKYG